jgi:hypothetical protein
MCVSYGVRPWPSFWGLGVKNPGDEIVSRDLFLWSSDSINLELFPEKFFLSIHNMILVNVLMKKKKIRKDILSHLNLRDREVLDGNFSYAVIYCAPHNCQTDVNQAGRPYQSK